MAKTDRQFVPDKKILVPAGTVVSGAGTITGGAAGQGLLWIATGLIPYTDFDALLNLTAAATAVGDTLDVFLDTTFDLGTTWVNIAHFPQLLGNGGAKKYLLTFRSDAHDGIADVSADAAANVARGALGDQLRVRTVAVQASAVSFTLGLHATVINR